MRKAIVYTRPLPSACRKITTDAPAIVEVEGDIIPAMEDPSVMWLPKGEFKFRITVPDFLYEPQEIRKADISKDKVMVPPVYHSHSVYDTFDGARQVAKQMVEESFQFVQRKTGRTYSEDEVAIKLTEIQEIMLP